MTELPAEVTDCLRGLPTVGEMDQAFPLLTVNDTGGVDVCLLSRTELRASDQPGADLAAVVASRRARANLAARPQATVMVVAADAVHTVSCVVDRREDTPDAAGLLLRVTDHRRDSVGVEVRPLQFRVEERLRVQERWDRTEAIMGALSGPAVNR